MFKKLHYLQSIILAGGVFFSWFALSNQFAIFWHEYGTFFRFSDCVIPNPLITPCFYGSLAFLGAFVWSLLLIGKHNEASQKWLRNFLLFGVFFALFVLGYETLQYYKMLSLSVPQVSCAPGVPPFQTPCFIGLLFFVAGVFASFFFPRPF